MRILIFCGVLVWFCGVESSPIKHSAGDGFTMRIVHTNDMHARFEETNQYSAACTKAQSEAGKCYGGFARLATLIRRERDSPIPTLFLNAGDTYQGTIWYSVFKWKIVSKMMNMLEPDAVSLGNHEFDDGVSGLVPFLDRAEFPIVTANLDLHLEPRLQAAKNLKNSTILQVGNEKVAVIGYLTPETKSISSTENVIFRDEVEAIREEIARIKEENDDIKIFIALGHSGYSVDKRIAAEVEDIDLVIGGHTNTFLYNGKEPDVEVPDGLYPTVVEQDSGRKAYVVQAYAYTKYLGNLTIDFNADGEITNIVGSPTLVDSSIPQAKDILDELNVLRKNISSIQNEQVGSTKVFLDGDSKKCRFFECNLGNLITDAMINYNVKQQTLKDAWTTAAIALHNSGTVRTSITDENDGKISRSDVLTVLPFENVIFKATLTGKAIVDMLEWSVHTIREDLMNDPFGGFLQMSGMKVTYDLSKEPFSRVNSSKVFVMCADCKIPEYDVLDINKNYTVLIPDYMYNGGDGFEMIKGAKYQSLGVTSYEIVVEYLKQFSPVYSAIEGRINYASNESDSPKSSASSISSTSILFLILIQIYLFVLR